MIQNSGSGSAQGQHPNPDEGSSSSCCQWWVIVIIAICLLGFGYLLFWPSEGTDKKSGLLPSPKGEVKSRGWLTENPKSSSVFEKYRGTATLLGTLGALGLGTLAWTQLKEDAPVDEERDNIIEEPGFLEQNATTLCYGLGSCYGVYEILVNAGYAWGWHQYKVSPLRLLWDRIFCSKQEVADAQRSLNGNNTAKAPKSRIESQSSEPRLASAPSETFDAMDRAVSGGGDSPSLPDNGEVTTLNQHVDNVMPPLPGVGETAALNTDEAIDIPRDGDSESSPDVFNLSEIQDGSAGESKSKDVEEEQRTSRKEQAEAQETERKTYYDTLRDEAGVTADVAKEIAPPDVNEPDPPSTVPAAVEPVPANSEVKIVPDLSNDEANIAPGVTPGDEENGACTIRTEAARDASSYNQNKVHGPTKTVRFYRRFRNWILGDESRKDPTKDVKKIARKETWDSDWRTYTIHERAQNTFWESYGYIVDFGGLPLIIIGWSISKVCFQVWLGQLILKLFFVNSCGKKRKPGEGKGCLHVAINLCYIWFLFVLYVR